MRTRLLPIVLSSKFYAELERQARAQERSPHQQARFLLKQALVTNARPVNLEPELAAPTCQEPSVAAR
jgi:hypothetical protein